MGRPKKITFTKDELNSIGNSLNELIPQTINPLREDIKKVERDLRQVSENMIYLDALLQAILEIQDYLIKDAKNKEREQKYYDFQALAKDAMIEITEENN